EKKPIYCSKHKLQDMICVVRATKCSHEYCNTYASYGYDDQYRRRTHCSVHKTDGMVHLSKSPVKCKYRPIVHIDGLPTHCSNNAEYNYPGTKGNKYCDLHKLEGMVRIKNKRLCYTDG